MAQIRYLGFALPTGGRQWYKVDDHIPDERRTRRVVWSASGRQIIDEEGVYGPSAEEILSEQVALGWVPAALPYESDPCPRPDQIGQEVRS